LKIRFQVLAILNQRAKKKIIFQDKI